MARSNRIFVSFAVANTREGSQYRDFLVGHARNVHSPFEFVDMSVKEPWDSEWKTRCRVRIRQCDGLIALISRHTMQADGARWEIKCAHDENIPILAIHVQSDNKGVVPPELAGHRVIEWEWERIAKFMNAL